MAHRVGDVAGDSARLRLTSCQACEHGLDDVLDRQPLLGVKAGSAAYLGVYGTIGRQVLNGFVGDPFNGVCGLHHGNRVDECLQIALQ